MNDLLRLRGKTALFFLSWCVAVFCWSGTLAWGQQIILKSDAIVRGPQVTLGMVAELSPNSTELAEKRLVRSPEPAQSIVIKRDQILRTLRQNGIDPATVSWAGASAVRVEGASQTIAASEIQGEIDTYLRDAELRFSHARFTFTPFTAPEPLILPAGTLHVEVIPAVRDIIGSRHFTLIYRVDGRTVVNMAVRGKLLAEAEVVVVRQSLRRGSTISADDVELVSHDISRVRDPLFELEDVIGKRVARGLRAGQIVERKNVEFPPLVKKGAFVRIAAKRGAMLLTAIGIAREDGQLNQVIRVQNSSSQKQIQARVVAPDRVEVEF